MVQFYTPRKRVITTKPLRVTISALDAFGQGIAHAQNKTLFIPDALPGETVDIKITEEKKQIMKGRVLKRHNDSPDRITPRCPHYGVCGGCQMQHIATPLQHKIKQEALVNILQRETQQTLPEATVIFGAEYGYRRRARLALFYDKKQLKMGFRQAKNSDIINIEQCPILVPALAQLIAPLYSVLSELQCVTRLGHVELTAADNTVVLVLRVLGTLSPDDQARLTEFAGTHQLAFYAQTDETNLTQLSGQAPYYQLNDLRLDFSPKNFIQVNQSVNEQMVAQAISWLDVQPTDVILDLFCGMGNFTLPLAQRASQVIGVEGVLALTQKSQENAERNGISNVQFYNKNLDEKLTKQSWLNHRINKVLLDPARAGAFMVMSTVVELAPTHIVYVSCHPATLARDCQVLVKAGYRIQQVCMLDMFPQTKHLESMVFLTKK